MRPSKKTLGKEERQGFRSLMTCISFDGDPSGKVQMRDQVNMYLEF